MESVEAPREESSRFSPFGAIAILVLGLLIGGLAYYAMQTTKKSDKSPPKKPPVPVMVATVIQKTIPVMINTIGTVEAYSTVTVKAQVGGTLIKVCFEEGHDVKKGDVLFEIDPRPFEAAIRVSQANLERDTATSTNADAEAQRYARLVESKVISKEEYDRTQTNAESLRAAVRADAASLENARLQLEYCTIRSPIDGRTGSIMVHQGNLVKANDDKAMMTINQVVPIYVSFAVPEMYLPEIKKHIAPGKLKVEAFIPNEENAPVLGVVTFMDNAVDTTTGTIRLKATYSNEDRRLWPGQFVTVALTLTSEPNALLVPAQAIQPGQKGQYVYVVKPDQTVEDRAVVSNRTLESMAIVESGLKPSEVVVTDGQLLLVPGAKIEVKTGLLPAPEPKADKKPEGAPKSSGARAEGSKP